MNFKIDTKEKMHVITVNQEELAANMTEEIQISLLKFLSEPIKNVVLNLHKVSSISENIGNLLLNTQKEFYNNNHSFVICNLQPAVEGLLKKNELLDEMNITPTESEASDIVQMEEIEREFL